MTWFLRGFDRESERLADDRPRRGVDMGFFVPMLEPHVDGGLDLAKYEYFVEFERDA